jgi:hypothetical protein
MAGDLRARDGSAQGGRDVGETAKVGPRNSASAQAQIYGFFSFLVLHFLFYFLFQIPF